MIIIALGGNNTNANQPIEITPYARGHGLQICTPDRYAMGLAIEILAFFDSRPGVSVKNTGWKQGFGLEVAAWVPITTTYMVAELQTDGSSLDIRHVSGSGDAFERLLDDLDCFLSDYDVGDGEAP